jgi:hypothetical protein
MLFLCVASSASPFDELTPAHRPGRELAKAATGAASRCLPNADQVADRAAHRSQTEPSRAAY